MAGRVARCRTKFWTRIRSKFWFGYGQDNHAKRVTGEFAKTLMNVELQILIVILMLNVSIKKVFMNVSVTQVRDTWTVRHGPCANKTSHSGPIFLTERISHSKAMLVLVNIALTSTNVKQTRTTVIIMRLVLISQAAFVVNVLKDTQVMCSPNFSHLS